MIVPKILKRDGYIKLFYMGAFQNYREATVNPLLVSWPEPEMRTGDFSKLVNGAGQAITIYDPTTAIYDASGNIVTNRTPFPGNMIPATAINPAAQVLTKLMPLPNTATPGQRYGTEDLSLPEVTDHDAYYNMTIKFDWTIGDKNRVLHARRFQRPYRASSGQRNRGHGRGRPIALSANQRQLRAGLDQYLESDARWSMSAHLTPASLKRAPVSAMPVST